MNTEKMIVKIYEKMQEMQTDLQGVKADLQGVKTDLQEVKADLQGVKTELQEVKTDLQNQINDVRLTLENVTNRNISIVAEGHLDLFRRLEEALKEEKEKEKLRMRVNSLENEMRRVKEFVCYPA